MSAMQLLRVSVHERIRAAAEHFLLRLEKGEEPARVPALRAMLTERLTAEIVAVFEETVAEYEDRVERSEREVCRQRRLLDAVMKPEVRLHRADVQQLVLSKAEVPPEQQPWSPLVDQEDPEPPHIKEEQEELWTKQEGEADIKFTLIPVAVKSEEDEETPQSSQLHQSQTEENRANCGGPEPEPARNSGPEGHLEPGPETEESSETADSEGDWMETREPQPVSDTDQKPFNCSECSKTFSRKDYLKTHVTVHTGEKPFSCSDCGNRFTRKEHLKTHMKIHTGEKPFCCSECGKRFRIKGEMLTHMSVHTGEKPFSCSECGKIFRLKRQLLKHGTTHTGVKPFSCSECGKRFGQKEYLRSHMRIHTGEKPFSCSECGKRYHHQAGLQAHMRNHTGEKPFSCSECGKRFNHKSRLQIHERIHTRDQPFTCSECGQRFSYQANLVAHLRSHTGEKPFSCSECGQSFSRKDSLQIHARLHTGEKPFSCSICNKRFSWIYQQKNHQCIGETSELHQNQREGSREDCGGPEPARNSGPDWSYSVKTDESS